VGAAEIRPARDQHASVGDRLLKRCENAGIAGRVMSKGRERVAISLRNVLSQDSAGFIRLRAD
jgi:hypothetical protein